MRALLLSTLMMVPAAAQTIEVESLFQPAPLAGVWKHQMGDDARWADPAFDDSAWPSVRMPERAAQPGDGLSWYRFRVRLPENRPKEALALMIGPFAYGQAYEVFWNGRRAGTVGDPDGSRWGLLLPTPQMVEIPGDARDGVVAIRLRAGTYPFVYRLDPAHRSSWIGVRQPINALVEVWWGERLRDRQPQLLVAASIIMPAVFFLLLPLWRRDGPEYFWFGLWLLFTTLPRVQNVLPEILGLQTAPATSWAFVLANPVSIAGWVGMMSTMFRCPISPVAWFAAAAGIAVYAGPVSFITMGGSLPRNLSTVMAMAHTGCLGLIYYELGWRNSHARERMPAIHLAILIHLAVHFACYVSQIAWNTELTQLVATLVRTCVLLLFAFAMAILMNQRSARLLVDRQRLGREMESAAEVQALMLTSLPATGDAYQIEPIYLPASEVGGDFYQLLDRADGSRVVLVGDVSGKGLKAAMLVSATIGMLRREQSSSPGAILAGLNDGLAGHVGGGFVTCCCARFAPDGAVTIANAGHPAPYCDGREVAMEAGLPLGVVRGTEYAESVERGKQFTFVSDGVVEAENAQRELFGFDRTREISTKSAQEIAEAAKAWGQNDDITVVTVRRLA